MELCIKFDCQITVLKISCFLATFASNLPTSIALNTTSVTSTPSPFFPTTQTTTASVHGVSSSSVTDTATVGAQPAFIAPNIPQGLKLKFDGGIDRIITLNWQLDPIALYWNVERNCTSSENPTATIRTLDPFLVDYQVHSLPLLGRAIKGWFEAIHVITHAPQPGRLGRHIHGAASIASFVSSSRSRDPVRLSAFMAACGAPAYIRIPPRPLPAPNPAPRSARSRPCAGCPAPSWL